MTGCGQSDEAPAAVDLVPVEVEPVPISEVRQVPPERISVAASSAADLGSPDLFGAEFVADGNPETGWISAEGEAPSGQQLTFRFTEPLELRAVAFVGLDESTAAGAHRRVKTLRMRTDSQTQEINLLDRSGEQQIEFFFGLTSKVQIEILDTYETQGEDGEVNGAPVALADVLFTAGLP